MRAKVKNCSKIPKKIIILRLGTTDISKCLVMFSISFGY